MKLRKEQRMSCAKDGVVLARLTRGRHRYQSVWVEDALAYVCPSCGKALGFPHVSAGRIAKAVRSKEPPETTEFRVPASVVDHALHIHAALGTLGAGEDFTLPVHLGLHIAGNMPAPAPSWRAFDDEPRDARARPRLSGATLSRIRGLSTVWGAESTADVVRWLVLAAYQAVSAGLTARTPAIEVIDDYSETFVADTLLLEAHEDELPRVNSIEVTT